MRPLLCKKRITCLGSILPRYRGTKTSREKPGSLFLFLFPKSLLYMHATVQLHKEIWCCLPQNRLKSLRKKSIRKEQRATPHPCRLDISGPSLIFALSNTPITRGHRNTAVCATAASASYRQLNFKSQLHVLEVFDD